MQNNVKINTPVTTVDPNARMRPVKEPPTPNLIDPTRVTSGTTAQGAAQQNQENTLNLLLNQNSVFNRFINQLAAAPGLSNTLKKVMFEAFSMDGKALTRSGEINNLLSELATKLKLSPDQIVEALKYQNDNQTKFGGQLFDTLRELQQQNVTNKQFEALLGRFLKSYNGFFSTEDTLKAVIVNLKQIQDSMPRTHAMKLDTLIGKLFIDNPAGNLDQNLQTLKNDVIPFLSNYIAVTNDFGKVRDTITLLINNIARLNTGSRDGVIESFVELLDFCKFTFDISDSKIEELKQSFAQQMGKSGSKPTENELFATVTKLIAEGQTKEQSQMGRTIYREIATSLLLDNSVFMPLNHLFLPINYNGKFMFTELWVEKDSEHKAMTVDQKPITRMLINFDIKGIGFFEAVLWMSEGNVDVELNYPSTLSASGNEIRDNVGKIFRKNGMNMNNMVLSVDEPAKRVQDVFKNLFDARRGVNVTV